MASGIGGGSGGTRGGGNNRDITVLNPDNTVQRVINSGIVNSGNPGGAPAPTLTQAAGGWGQPSGGTGQPNLGGGSSPQGLQIIPGLNAGGITDAQGRPTGQGANNNYTGRAFGPAGGGGGSGVSPSWVNNGTISYIPGGSNPVAQPHWIQMDPRTGQPIKFGIAGPNAQDEVVRRAQEAGRVTGEGMMAEALGLQQNLEAFNTLASEIRKLGIDDKLVTAATNNLMAILDDKSGNDTWLKSGAFQSNVDFVNEQTARRLSPSGYAPGEHSYGDNTIAQATGQMAQDWTRTWYDFNMGVVNQGNQLAQIGAQGQIRAGELAVQMNPAGLYAGGGVARSVAALNPEQAWADWQKERPNWMDNFKPLGT